MLKTLVRRLTAALSVAILAAMLAACATGGATTPAATNAATTAAAPASSRVSRVMQAIGLAKPPPPAPTEKTLQLRMFTAQNLNAGATDKPLALVVKILYLRSLDRFQQAQFNDFLTAHKIDDALGGDLLASREMLLLPDQKYTSTEHMPLDTRYLGIVALFRGPAANRWRFAYDVNKSAATGITLGVHGCAMSSTAGALVTELPDNADSLADVRCPRPND